MTIRVDSASLISGKTVVSLFAGNGIRAQDIPSTGTSGAGYLYNDITAQGAAPMDEMRGEILAWPSAGTLTVNEDSSFSFTDAPDGTYTFDYRGFRNGAAYGDFTVTLNIGDGATYTLTALGASYSYAGASASLLRGFVMDAQGGAYSYDGSDAVLRRGFKLAANGGAYGYAGADASLTYVAGPTVYRITALGVTYVYSGAAATLTATGVAPAANPNAFHITARVAGPQHISAMIGGTLTNNAKIGGNMTISARLSQ